MTFPKYELIPPALKDLHERIISEEEVIETLRHLIPPVYGCLKGCTECCVLVPFTEYELAQVPKNIIDKLELKPMFMVIKGAPGGLDPDFQGRVYFLTRPGQLKVKDLKRTRTVGDVMQLGKCPFIQAGKCLIYEHRPIICRLFGAASEPNFTCSHGARSANLLSRQVSFLISSAWFQMFNTKQPEGEKT